MNKCKYEIFELSNFKWNKKSHINYLEGDFSNDAFRYKVVYDKIKFLSNDYPGFKEWYFNKVIPGLDIQEREILICIVNEENKYMLGGIAILKKTEEEKKICTLRVTPEYEKNGVGYALFDRAFEILDTIKPVFTVSEDRIEMFKRHLDKYNFVQTHCIKDIYSKGKCEYVFNGSLS